MGWRKLGDAVRALRRSGVNWLLSGNLVETAGWSDYLADLSAGRGVGANAPTWTTMVGGVSAFRFSAIVQQEVCVNFHINHDYKPGTLIFPHVHWVPATAGAGVVRWGIEYTKSIGHNQAAFGATQTVYIEQAAPEIALQHMIAEHLTGVDFDVEVDSLICVRVFRDAAHANDTHTGAVFGLMCDLHVQVERHSTPNKAPDFYATGD